MVSRRPSFVTENPSRPRDSATSALETRSSFWSAATAMETSETKFSRSGCGSRYRCSCSIESATSAPSSRTKVDPTDPTDPADPADPLDPVDPFDPLAPLDDPFEAPEPGDPCTPSIPTTLSKLSATANSRVARR